MDKIKQENKALLKYLDKSFDVKDVKHCMQRINWIITSWAGLLDEYSPITNIDAIVGAKVKVSLIASQFEKYKLVPSTAAGEKMDESIKQLQILTAQITRTVDNFKKSS